ncbi:UDP-N-acetylglucosamine 1-carboxyvinyltransferase [Candidatus Amoebophilus asiaticus 5a2]|uniref:UDP-N-acetylglucosamine 1-carboxyvinyltransferase n=1 Tax=Amoebophilus asiaticus (strain 5a2) TaxID=452471 RepID=B3EU72_AMOA5|nr:UDP-N-acetylglucosamine 1-carboxyvinyltransferase [Candidatus Amoebophilus asiaticus]ACE05491.1 UDP-N-acetylglucosamine 1-carboxyvinyltransferase [Candidatus Amoebophilus asiaticus 5a2]
MSKLSKFKIYGGKPLHGTIQPQGSKNEAFQVMCAALLTTEPVTIYNVPDILDVHELLILFGILGVKVQKIDQHTYRLHAADVSVDTIDIEALTAHGGKLRASVLMLGPLVARLGKAIIPQPGGDKIGRRRLDTHFIGISRLGATFNYDEHQQVYMVEAKNKLQGDYILLDESSVTGTANIIMAAALAQGKTTIYNAACEPHIQQLCKMLVQMGAHIEGIGSNLLTIYGVETLCGTEHTILPDMLEIGSFIGLAAMTNSHLTIQNAISSDQLLEPALSRFRSLGIKLDITGSDITIPSQSSYEIQQDINTHRILTLADAVWPGLPSDLLSILLVTAIQAKGSVLFHQKMYESRLFFVDNLIEMGAKLVLCDPHRVHVVGLDRSSPLKGIRMTSPDIRAGISLLIAALSAEGKSIIEHANQIDRGYERIEERLKVLGADIERIE